MTIYRQGDVMLVKETVSGKRFQTGQLLADPLGEEDAVILALGEVTGHAHAIRGGKATMFVADRPGSGADFSERYIDVQPGALLTHEEHTAIPLEPGTYRVVQQREYEQAGRFVDVAD